MKCYFKLSEKHFVCCSSSHEKKITEIQNVILKIKKICEKEKQTLRDFFAAKAENAGEQIRLLKAHMNIMQNY